MSDNLARKEWQEPYQVELIHGNTVVMSPRPIINHTLVSRRISHILENFFAGKPCVSFPDGVDVHLTDEDWFVPDAFVVCDRNKIRWDGIYGAPDLVVEVLSPGTAKRDRTDKMEVYERCGVREYWLADPAAKSLEQYLLEDGRFRLRDVYTWYPGWQWETLKPEDRAEIPQSFHSGIFPDLELNLSDIFSNLIQGAAYGGE